MSFLSVDQKKCAGDGMCAKVCPLGLIYLDGQKTPQAVEGAKDACLNCGHCVSVCPHGALSTEKMAADQCPPLPEGWDLPLDRVEPLLKGRRSIRQFKADAVPRQDLEKAIDVARYAPSGVNRQPLRWTVIYDREKVKQISAATIEWMDGLVKQQTPLAVSLRWPNLIERYAKGRDLICWSAPHIIYAYALKEEMMAPVAASIACTFLDLACVSMGMGACWGGYVQMALNSSDACRKIAGLNARCACFGAMMVGYPAVKYSRIPARDRAPISFK
ncbi:MAG: nitroreductase family protein [Deltaproteobacteria bacterium]